MRGFQYFTNKIHSIDKQEITFSLAELKAQVSFSDGPSSVCLCENFSHFRLLLQNWANFNHTWHKASLVKGAQVSSNEEPHPFPRGDNYEIVKTWTKL